jgi:hypothetical protein
MGQIGRGKLPAGMEVGKDSFSWGLGQFSPIINSTISGSQNQSGHSM